MDDLSRARGARPLRLLPEPSRFWITRAPSRWLSAAEPWTDLAGGGLRFGDLPPQPPPAYPSDGSAELCYLPPVAAEHAEEREALARVLIAEGSVPLLQLRPGERVALGGAALVYDLLGACLEGDPSSVSELPAGAFAVWPLVAGLSDEPAMIEEVCARLAAVGAKGVQALPLQLSTSDRRRLAERGGEELFDALFHRSVPSERPLAQVTARHGMEIFMPRPETQLSRRLKGNRHIASELALLGELWLRLGRGELRGQAYLRAAREAEFSPYDLAALAREGNLEVMDWLDPELVAEVRSVLDQGRSPFVEALLEEYLG